MKNIRIEVVINSPISKVWQVLMDFASYPDWNTFMHIKGSGEVGSNLENTMMLEGQKPQVFRPLILENKKEKELRWKGKLFLQGLFDGEHYFLLESLGQDKTRLIHGEKFSGILSSVVLKMIGEKTVEGFEKMNLELKMRSEKMTP